MNAMAIDARGNIFFSDSTCAIRKIDASTGIITRVAGTGDNISTPYSGDGIPARLCHIGAYIGLHVDDTGNIYICDYVNSRIEKVDTFGIIHTIAGNGVAGFSGDGTPATSAEINHPENVILDKCNNVFISDFGNRRVRKVTYPTLALALTNTVTASSGDTVCSGTVSNYSATITSGVTGVAYTYRWYVNGSVVSTVGSSYAYTPSNGDSVRCVVTGSQECSGNDTVSSNTINMVVNPTIIPSVNISASTGAVVCSGTSVTYTVAATGGGAAPAYQWLVNGSAISGGTASSYTYTPANEDSIRCILTSSAPCAAPATISSNSIIMSVGATEVPGITVTVSPGDTLCAGTGATYTASVTLGGVSPVYQWVVDGSSVGTSANTYAYTPANGDSIRCILTSSAPCALPATVSSNTINMLVDNYTASSVSVAAPASAVAGSTVTVNATVTPPGISSYSIKWFNNGTLFNTTSVPTVTYTKPAGTDHITARVIPSGCYDSSTSSVDSVTTNTTGTSPQPSPKEREVLRTYPNPVHGSLTLSISDGKDITHVDVCNLLGQTFMSTDYHTHKVNINTEALPSGIYVVKVTDSEGGKNITKIVKE